mgnify:CR=1 FL=1
MWAGEDSNLRRQCRRVYSPFPLATRAPTQERQRLPGCRAGAGRFGDMPTFDVVSEVDLQEVRNAVDQAAREKVQQWQKSRNVAQVAHRNVRANPAN